MHTNTQVYIQIRINTYIYTWTSKNAARVPAHGPGPMGPAAFLNVHVYIYVFICIFMYICVFICIFMYISVYNQLFDIFPPSYPWRWVIYIYIYISKISATSQNIPIYNKHFSKMKTTCCIFMKYSLFAYAPRHCHNIFGIF